jgi:hypothetical protein
MVDHLRQYKNILAWHCNALLRYQILGSSFAACWRLRVGYYCSSRRYQTSCPMRRHAEKLLDMIDSANAFKIGLTTDYVLEAVRHVRLVEVDDHDPARTPGVVRDLVARLIVLYRDAFVAVRAPPGEPRMMTEIVMSQLAESRAIHYNGKVKILYDASTKESARDGLARMNVVVDVLEARLLADFSSDKLESCLDAMALVEWEDKAPSAIRLGNLKQYVRRLFGALRLNTVRGLNQFLYVLPRVIAHGRTVALRDSCRFDEVDFREVWEIVHSEDFALGGDIDLVVKIG